VIQRDSVWGEGAVIRSVRRCAILLALSAASLMASATDSESGPGATTRPCVPDRAAIERVLSNYRTAVTNNDEALFMTTILDDQIPFYSAGDRQSQAPSLNSVNIRGLAQFRHAVFHNNTRYRQTFDHVFIEQDGSLACVRLHFVTQIVSSGDGGEGWKTLQLLKVGADWKIVSELYTVRSLHSQPAAGNEHRAAATAHLYGVAHP